MPLIDFSLQEAFVTADGIPIVASAPEDFITIAEPNDLATVEDTADGFTVVSGSRARRRQASLMIMQGGPGWTVMDGLKRAQQAFALTTFVFVVSIRVGAERVTYTCPNAKITKAPDEDWKRTLQSQTWEIVMPDVIEVRAPA
jgi:hypothetical protein